MSQWNINYVMMRDFSVAQGHGVTSRMERVVAGNDESPLLQYYEETHHHYYRKYLNSRNIPAPPPDLGIIQEMLRSMRLGHPPPSHYNTPKKPSALNPDSAEFVPQYNEHRSNLDINGNQFYNSNQADTNTRDMNVTLTSLRERSNDTQQKENVVLLKPDDILRSNGNAHDAMAQKEPITLRPLLPARPTEISTKKPPTQKVKYNLESHKYQLDMSPPIEYAQVYYNRSMEKPLPRVKSHNEDDMWVKLEREMRELERKRKLISDKITAESGWKDININLNIVRLPFHRHVIIQKCVVCSTVKKHNYDVDRFPCQTPEVYRE